MSGDQNTALTAIIIGLLNTSSVITPSPQPVQMSTKYYSRMSRWRKSDSGKCVLSGTGE